MDQDRFSAAPCVLDAPEGEGGKSYVGRPLAHEAPPRLRHSCYAPTFEGRSALACFFFAILTVVYLFVLYLLLILTLGSDAIQCEIRKALFRVQHCRTGNSDPGIDLGDPYQQHVHRYRNLYGKDAVWEQWMLDNRNRYEHVFRKATARPSALVVAFRYDSTPIAYSPPWASESEHMQALKVFSDLTYPGYNFSFVFNGDPVSSYANAIAGIPTNLSNASGKNVYLYYETIWGHEFAHVMGVAHHYDSVGTIGAGLHMPPGETKCIMDRTISQFCSACRAALDLPLNVDNAAGISAAAANISSRYPY